MRAMMMAAVIGITGCSGAPSRQDATPSVAVAPSVVTIQRISYVKIPAELTRVEPIAEGPIAQCFDVAAQRRAALERANAKLRQIAQIQGTEASP